MLFGNNSQGGTDEGLPQVFRHGPDQPRTDQGSRDTRLRRRPAAALRLMKLPGGEDFAFWVTVGLVAILSVALTKVVAAQSWAPDGLTKLSSM